MSSQYGSFMLCGSLVCVALLFELRGILCKHKCMSAELEAITIGTIIDGLAEIEQLIQNTFISGMYAHMCCTAFEAMIIWAWGF